MISDERLSRARVAYQAVDALRLFNDLCMMTEAHPNFEAGRRRFSLDLKVIASDAEWGPWLVNSCRMLHATYGLGDRDCP